MIRSADVGDNWVLKINNLKKLYKLVSRYYEEVLGLDFHKTPDVNLNAIAKDSDVRETLKLCKLVLCIAVLCSDNERYIQKIQSMPQESQQILMIFIDEIIKNTGGGQEEEDPHLAGDNYTPRSSYADDGTYKSQSELARISKDKEELEVQNRQLIDKHSQLLNKYVSFFVFSSSSNAY